MAMTPSLELILPMLPSPGRPGSDLTRALRGLLPSLVLQGYPQFTRRFAIICPAADRDLVADTLASAYPCFPYFFYTDEEILGLLGYRPAEYASVPGWFKQQLFKLAAGQMAVADVALFLDSDVVASAPIPLNDLSQGIIPYHRMGIARFYKWFETSAAALQIDMEELPPAMLEQAMGVTPEFLSSPVLQRMIARLTNVSGGCDWARYLMTFFKDYDTTWTEYSLYWVSYAADRALCAAHRPTCLYRFIENQAEACPDLLGPQACPFTVLQGTKLTLDDCAGIYTRISELLPRDRPRCQGAFR